MQDTVYNYYNTKILALETDLKKIRTTIAWLYFARFVTFILVIAFIILFIKYNNNYLFLVFSFISLIIFLIIVKFDLKYSYKEKFHSNKLNINQNELKYLNHQYLDKPSGSEYTYLNPHLVEDFDIFGKGSLFQYLNRCSTKIGKDKLANDLCCAERNINIIFKKQQAIKELSAKTDFMHNFQAYGLFISENGKEIESLENWLKESTEKLKLLDLIIIIIPLINLIWYTFLAFGIFSLNSLSLPILLSLGIVGMNSKRISKAHNKLGKTAKTFEKYTSLIRLIENENFESAYLSELQHELKGKDEKASNSLRSLFKLLNSFDIRYNLIVSFLLNTILVFDIQVYCRMEKWKAKHKNRIKSWFSTLSQIDAMISYASFAYNNQNEVCYPHPSDKEFLFEAEEMGHPLLHPSLRINNSVHFSGTPSVMIITGANMAGKSTFLRTIAVNLLLAMKGAPICAKSLVFKPCDLLSSIKIQDSLANNESYFYAELIRLKAIIEHVKAQSDTFVVLDEILRGTNTKDKQLGSLGLIEKLISQHAIVIIATHDLSIGELENKYPDIVSNHCFEVELTNDQLIFDYKLKKGISQKLNASFLMKKMGIINEE
ncbi:MAG: MutS-related protein [Bacteroidales bacterium]